ncbi:MAG: phenylacetic acid degradation bifunctional protein PaaZ [Saprospiraceae bacterium]|nr:phenylacetic acid degradation bifunctional protein PaaZ [Saprospiraceae bacterium]
MVLKNFIAGDWVQGTGQGQKLFDASTGEVITEASTQGINMASAYDFARSEGNKKLRKMTFQQRGIMLKQLALYLMDRKEKYYEWSYKTGATRGDSWIDIEGGIGNLFANASLRRKMPDLPYYIEGDSIGLSKGGTFIGHHILVPKEGVAVHINAFNFPVWGMLEKCAVNWLAGMPAIVKPATLTSYLTAVVVEDIIASGILPVGALQLVCGGARDILDYVESQDVVTFTGSASTGLLLKSNSRLLAESVPFNMEADSLNSMVLGHDVSVQDPEFDIFIKEVRKEITVKSGQKCTAVRRIFVPEHLIEDVQIALGKALAQTTVGDPRVEGVRMGALAGKTQLAEVREKVQALMLDCDLVYGDLFNVELHGNTSGSGSFMSPVLLRNDRPFEKRGVHDIEAFGPVSTLMPYKDIEEVVELVRLGKGSLCCSYISYNDHHATEFVVNAATHHGRILVLNRDSYKESTGHGSPMPLLVHGGPGRAGGGEEMGGLRGVKHYMQRCAIQGSPTTLTAITQQYQYGGKYKIDLVHPFKKHFEELLIGETLITHKRTITESDIVNFANVSWDHFYAHTDETSLEGTPFTQRVAHGYFILSAAAGLFVDAAKGPVMLNYGLDECRFVKPVYPGMTIGVRLTVKEKVVQEKKDTEDYRKGIVKWLVDVYDETGESVALATILTMVKCKNVY